MERIVFQKLMQEAGFKNKKELAKAMNLPYSSVNNWGSGAEYPNYCEAFLNALVKAKKYDEALKSGTKNVGSLEVSVESGDFAESEELERLKLENARLKEELEEYESLKRALKRALGL